MNTTTRQTSADAFKEIHSSKLLHGLELKVYDVLFADGPLTAAETAKQVNAMSAVHHQIDSIRPRFAMLQKRKVVAAVGERACTITGQKALVWDVTPGLPVEIVSVPLAGKSRNKLAVARREIKALKKEVTRLEGIVQNQQQQLRAWGRPTEAKRQERIDTATRMLPLG